MKMKRWLFVGAVVVTLATVVAQTKPFGFIIAGKNVQLPTLEQKGRVFVDIAQLGKSLGFGVKIDAQKRTVLLTNTSSINARLTPPINPNAPIQVDTTTDTVDAKPGDAICADTGGKCSLRAALQEVIAQKLTREIRIPSGTYLLEKGALTIPDNRENANFEVRLRGENPDSVIINADGRDRAFFIGSGQRVRLEGMTVRNGLSTEAGGAVFIYTNNSTPSFIGIKNLKFFANRSTQSGGALEVRQAFGKITLDISDSEFGGNTSGKNGGALDATLNNTDGLEITIQNTTFAENTSSNEGGAAWLSGVVKIDGNRFLKNTSLNGGAVYFSQAVSGQITNTSFEENYANLGGAITVVNSSPLLEKLSVSRNQAKDCGGGIYVEGSNSIIRKTFIFDNEVQNGNGGGVCFGNRTSPLINATTISKNRAFDGGAIGYSTTTGYIYTASIKLLNSTISANVARRQGGAIAMGENDRVLDSAYTTYFDNQAVDNTTNQIISYQAQMRGNIFVTTSGKNCKVTKMGSLGFNISSDDSCDFSSRGDLKNTDPKLAPLSDNGGGILTHMPMLGSPALDAVPLNTCEARDARDVTRPQGAACDIGAVERSATDK